VAGAATRAAGANELAGAAATGAAGANQLAGAAGRAVSTARGIRTNELAESAVFRTLIGSG
jgi:hypothetical protein